MNTVDAETSTPSEPVSSEAPLSPRRRRINNIHQSQEEEDQRQYSFEDLKATALRCEQLPNITEDQYNTILDQLVKERLGFAKSGDFEESITYTNAINYMISTKATHQRKEALREMENKYKEQIKSIENELQEFDNETRRLIRQQAEENEMAYQRLIKQHKKEKEEHLARWSSDAKVRQYNRASYQLSQLRKQARLLVQQCRFKEAESVAAEIKELERKEVENAHEAMQRDYDVSAVAMAKRHKVDLENHMQKFSLAQRNLSMKRKRLRAALENKLEKTKHLMQKECNADKVWNQLQMKMKEDISKGTNEPGIVTKRVDISTAPVKDDSTITLPPLTVRRQGSYNSFRKSLNNSGPVGI